jgi:rhamnose utilization protein RhaD (predicted bifunctional aldolase and dehydrogenase)
MSSGKETASIIVPGETELERLVNRSRLIGADPELVVHGGGNTSSKTRERDHLGRARDVLRIKGSGTDLKTIGADGFPGLFLDDLLALREQAEMSDEAMVAYLAHCMVEPGSRRPSIETLLHAFLPAAHVDHIHADVICALTNNAEPERHVREALGDDVAVVPYIRPGFLLSKQVGESSGARAVVLAKHGLVTWGETHEASYGLTLDLVGRAQAYLDQQLLSREAVTAPDLPDDERRALLATVRGLLSRHGRRILRVDPSQRTFADRADVKAVATSARATPDHILRIGARSAVVRNADEAAEVIAAFERDYREYFGRHQERLPAGMGMLSPLPAVILVPGLGAIAAGPDAKTAKVNAEVAYRSHRVTAMALDAFGEVDWLSEADVFDFDYWPLELAKLANAPAPKSLAGQIAILLDATQGAMLAVAKCLASEGAHLVLADEDSAAAGDLVASLPAGVAVTASLGAAVQEAVDAFGGADILVASAASDQLVADLGKLFQQQGLGGTVIWLGDGGVPSVADLGDDVRVNTIQVQADADPTHVAEAVAFLASSRAAGIRDTIVPVV